MHRYAPPPATLT